MNYRNAKYVTEKIIDCEIEHPQYGWIPYTLDPADTDMTINNDDLLAEMALKGDVAPYVPPTPEELYEKEAARVRYQRDMILQYEVDPVVTNVLRWSDMTEVKQQEWVDYRRALLDISLQEGFPFNIVWPVKPQ